MTEEKLKTLKDLEYENLDNLPSELLVSSDDLRQEAIKWIKEIRLAKEGESKIDIAYEFSENVNHFIKIFFNITEEDLK